MHSSANPSKSKSHFANQNQSKTMKRAYITPNVKLICLDTDESLMLITGSKGGLDGTSDGGNTGENGITGSESSRRNSIWGDED